MHKIREIIAVIASLLAFCSIPIFGFPFGGCQEFGYVTLEVGCSSWFEFLRGALVVAPILVISKHKLLLSTLSIPIVLAISVLGGIEHIRAGEHWDYFYENWNQIRYHVSQPILVGAVSVYGVFWSTVFIHNKIKFRDT